ncbi:MAG: threonylcarbamoyl-AMP synthase [Bacilli bacterium]|nr:threonylcarbamoyl-AMP synthase [Bacilli bacterium]
MKILDWKKEINFNELNEVNTCLENGGLVIFPTETVYGIGAIATNERAVDSIFIAKGRANDNPLIVHVDSIKEIEKYAAITNEIERKLINNFMPGPFTLILKKKDIIPSNVSANLDTVGIRIPSNKIANEILKYKHIPIAAPSANISGKPSGTNINDIKEEFMNKVDYIIDGDNTDIGLESTVVKVIDNIPVILRPGFITKEDIINAVGIVRIDNNIFKKAEGIVESPGMKYKHYAPINECKLIYIKDKQEKIEYFKKISDNDTLIIGSSDLSNISCKKFLYYGDKLTDISHNIFTLLREADTYNPKIILIEGVSKDGLGLAIMNRLIRASSYNYIEKI